MDNVLHTLIHETQPRTFGDAKSTIDKALATASHAISTKISQLNWHFARALAFHRDMSLDIPLLVDLAQIRDKHQIAVDQNLRRTNAKWSSCDYQPGQSILKKRHEWKKGEGWDGPYPIKEVHINSNITVEFREGITERLKIIRIKSYRISIYKSILKTEEKSVVTENSSTIIYLILSYLFSVLNFNVTFYVILNDLNQQ